MLINLNKFIFYTSRIDTIICKSWLDFLLIHYLMVIIMHYIFKSSLSISVIK